MKTIRGTLLLMAVVAFSGCDEWQIQGLLFPTSETVEKRFDESMEWNQKHTENFYMDVPTDDYNVYVSGDVHVDKTTNNITKFLSDEMKDPKAHFSIFLGDMIKDKGGMQILYDNIYRIPVLYEPFYAVAGNHDLYFNLWETYYSLFGSSTYTLTVKTPSFKDLYIFLDNAGGTFGASQLKWLKEQLTAKRKDCRYCFVSTHVNIFRDNRPMSEIANMPLEETYEIGKILADHDVNLVLQGHEHFNAYTEYRGVGYLTLDAIADWFEGATYVVMEVGDDVDYEFVKL